MKLSDIMSAMRLELYAETGLIIFFVVFLAICIKLAFFSPRDELERAARIPLDDQLVEARDPRKLKS